MAQETPPSVTNRIVLSDRPGYSRCKILGPDDEIHITSGTYVVHDFDSLENAVAGILKKYGEATEPSLTRNEAAALQIAWIAWLHDVFGQKPDWLEQAAELAPHLLPEG